ncbi:hypothetical protein DPMN_079959 [Dreissena polymorpha]|uniref:Uncharacterized protein n=1 Tax=Dreissena polymorpha TaxID=45954 RepID=A0A9D4BRD7_DREPO|nr:hypothetical protein DPMN_079959 [Dreissena polymorpha]
MNSEHPGGHVFQQTGYIFVHIENAPPLDIIGTILVTKFHDDHTINVASKVKNAQPHGGNTTKILLKLVQDIIRMNLLTKFHEDRTINVASRVLTRKNVPPSGGHVFLATGTIFKLFHDDLTKNVASRVLTRFYYSYTRHVTNRCSVQSDANFRMQTVE